MPTPTTWKAKAWSNTGELTLFDLVQGFAGTNITIASISAMKAKVFDAATMEQIGSELELSVASCVFDAVKTIADDPRYDGEDGFNVRVVIPGVYFADGGSTYLVFVYFYDQSTPAKMFPDKWEVETEGVLGI